MRTRGQALVLFVLLMLTTVVLAMMTISLSERTKERLELQMAADHAAWNNAVGTARAMNANALLVRAQIAHYVAVAGVQSLVSFAGTYRGYLNAVEAYYRDERARQSRSCNAGSPCGCAGRNELDDRITKIVEEQDRIRLFWRELDTETGRQIYGSTIVTLGLLAVEREMTLTYLIEEQLKDARLARKTVATLAGTRQGFDAPNLDAINLREIGAGGSTTGAILGRQAGNRHGLWAVMGTRGNPFVTAREGSEDTIERALRRVTGTAEPVVVRHFGTSYFSGRMHGNQPYTVNGQGAWGDDHGSLRMEYSGNGCTANARTTAIRGWVKSTDTTDSTDQHVWLPDPRGLGDDGDLGQAHTASICTSDLCPDLMFAWQDYNQALLPNAQDVFGQPKNYAVVTKDRSGDPADPWNLMFRFQQSTATAGTTIDLRGVMRQGTDLTKSTAIAAGIAYYHRPGHWKEPPNLFNPYWRAGLVRADIDLQARSGDLAAAVSAGGDPSASEAVRKLYAAGYRGIP